MPAAPSAPTSGRSVLAAAVVAEAVQRLESQAPLDDAAELRRAFHTHPTRAAQLAERSWLLGERLGLPQALARWRAGAVWVLLALALLIALLALGSARAVVGPDRSINAVAAFVGLLGLHFLTLAVWLLGGVWGVLDRTARMRGLSLGRLVLGLAARWPVDRGPHAVLLLRSATAVLQRARLWWWLTGALSHGIWTLAFALVLAALAFGFAFHAYVLNWESTILSATFFQRFVHITGALPALLGFPVPDAASVAQGGAISAMPFDGVNQDMGQSAWAWWLMGCVLVWGLLPRALLAALSGARWRMGVQRLARVDLTDPYMHRHLARLDALEPPPQVIDPEGMVDAAAVPSRPATVPGAPGAAGSWAVIGFELPPESAWPPPGLDVGAASLCQRIAGSSAEREGVLSALAAARPESLLLVVNATTSPDRGTARFLREAARPAQRTALWSLCTGPVDEHGVQRWQDWLNSEGFQALTLAHQAQEAMNWIARKAERHD
ncbi:DUF2868 domain-containing protein [Ottowia sp.]|uniref:DUF2868 domain-containing protein n=1 Tax=Ottowia sp. TaxID=1898956 RepID=UPI003A88367B